ncbi:MAG: universal stress protein [Betaproteobacteria bacterium]|nr:universal stress protein [Betaproteobacteria bacterium]
MLRLLVPIDGSETSLRAVDHLLKKIGWYKNTVEIHLLNVQPHLHQDVGMFVSHEQIREFHHEQGLKALKGARDKLDAAGAPYVFHIGTGEPAHVIAHYARERRCDQIFMGTRGLGSVASMLIGSVTIKVIHLTDIPVVLVK